MKVGDKVAIKETVFQSPLLQPGKTGVVVALVDCQQDPTMFAVAMDSGFLPDIGPGWCFYSSELELINE